MSLPTQARRGSSILHSFTLPRPRWAPCQLRQRSTGAKSNPLPFPDNLRQRYHPDFIRLYDRYLAERVDSWLLPFESRGKPTYGGLDAKHAAIAGVRWEDVSLRRGAMGVMPLRIYYPPGLGASTPIILHYPGGGFVLNTPDSEHGITSHLCLLSSAIVVSVGYRLAPEHTFPTAVHDALAALDWVKSQLMGPEQMIAVTGASAGGGLAATVGITEGCEGGIEAIGCWVPIVDWTFDPVPLTESSWLSTLPKSLSRIREDLLEYGETRKLEDLPDEMKAQLGIQGIDMAQYDEIADNPFLSTKKMAWFREQYLPDSAAWIDPFASPMYFFKSPGLETALPSPNLFAASMHEEQEEIRIRMPRRVRLYPPLSAMPLTVPPMRIVVAGGDVLRAQGEEFVKAARASLFPNRPRMLEQEEIQEAADDPYRSREEVWNDVEEEEMYRPEANDYVRLEKVEGAAHCLVSAAGESTQGMEELRKMASWLKWVLGQDTRIRAKF